jgi:preprotein translocase subunit SecE
LSWKVYRPGEGRISRLGALVAILAMGAFSAFRWYLWAEELGLRRWLPRLGVHQITWAEVGAGVIMVLFALAGYRMCFVRTGPSDFLIEMEIELRKVTWPQWRPLFRSQTELWGSTYVVLLVIAALAAFVGLVDFALGYAHTVIFLR